MSEIALFLINNGVDAADSSWAIYNGTCSTIDDTTIAIYYQTLWHALQGGGPGHSLYTHSSSSVSITGLE